MRPTLTWCRFPYSAFCHLVVVASKMITAFRSLGVLGVEKERKTDKEQQGVFFFSSPKWLIS